MSVKTMTRSEIMAAAPSLPVGSWHYWLGQAGVKPYRRSRKMIDGNFPWLFTHYAAKKLLRYIKRHRPDYFKPKVKPAEKAA